MIKTLLIDSNNNVRQIIDVVDASFSDGDSYAGGTIRIVDTVYSNEVIISSGYWNGGLFLKPEKPGEFYLWDGVTFQWVDTPLAPTISNISFKKEVQKLVISFNCFDANYPEIEYTFDLYRNTTNSSAGSILVAADKSYVIELNEIDNITYYFWVKWKYSTLESDFISLGQSPVVAGVGEKDIQPNAVTQTSFGYSTTGPTGINISTYIPVISGNLTNDSDNSLPFTISLYGKQNFSSGAKNTGWLFRDITLNQTIHNLGTFTEKQELFAVSIVYEIPANTTREIALYWAAQDNTVSLSNMAYQMIGIKR